MFTFMTSGKTGIKFKNIIKEDENFNVLKYGYLYNGGGVAVGDINNDGLPDIYISGNLAKSRLYLNKGNFNFEDITLKAGVGAAEYWNNGITMVDINYDGYLDIYVCNSTDAREKYRKNLLFINNGNLTFTESAAKYGIDDPSYSTHSVFFDYDKDGDLDMFSLNHSLDNFTAFNKETHKLKDLQDPKFGHRFYKNIGNRFVDATKEVGIIANVLNFGLGVAVADFNNDLWPDIYVCNDYFEQDYLFINNQDGTFSEQLEKYFSHISLSSMGTDAADFNNDGFIDLLTLDMLPASNYEQKVVAGPENYKMHKLLHETGFFHQTTHNMLQMNMAGKYFTEIGPFAGISSTNWSWSPLWCDFDNDGKKDLFISNGYGKNPTHVDMIVLAVKETIKEQHGEKVISQMDMVKKIPSTILNNYMFYNNGDLTFSNVTEDWGFDKSTLSNGTAYADLDNDGDMDLIINNINEYAYVYRNNSETHNDNHFLKIKLKGTGKNTMGIGARVDIKCKNKQYTQEFMPSRGYMSSMNYELIFGLGQDSLIDQLKIVWPDFQTEILHDLQADQTISLDYNNAKLVSTPIQTPIDSIFRPLRPNNILNFTHIENEYNDFKDQPLLIHQLSTQGPGSTTGDINGDNLTDIFIGGAKGQPGQLFIQQPQGTFLPKDIPWLIHDKGCEDIDALFVDVDSDEDLDLYVVSGGNDFSISSAQLQDRLYLNDGLGNFKKARKNLPKMLTSGSCVKASDFDLDGDIDFFVGGRLTPGFYPLAPRSYILQNDGHGFFKDITRSLNDSLMNPGMVTDAIWTDINDDQHPDLILVGEWMPIRFFTNNGDHFEETTSQSGITNSEGWWNTIEAGDFDNDGDQDYVLGNFGLNSQIKVSPQKPAVIYAKDFDGNGSLDAISCYYILGESHPFYSRDDLAAQIPYIKKKYPTYNSYSDQKISDIFDEDQLREAMELKATNFESSYMENKGEGQFELSALSAPAQFTPIYGIQTGDFNSDGNTDIILAGNFFGTRVKFGRYDANKGLLLEGDGEGHFKEIPNNISGLFVQGETRDIALLDLFNKKKMLIFVRNNQPLDLYIWDQRVGNN